MALVKSASLWAMVGSVGTRGLSFVFFLLIARVLAPAHLGVMALALAVGMFVDAVIEFGLVDQVVRHVEDDQAFFSSAFWLHVALGLGGFVLVFLAAPWVARWYAEPALANALRGVGLASALTATSLVPSALLTRRFEHRALAKRNTVATLVGGCLGLALAHAGHDIIALVAMHVANALTGTLMVWRSAAWRPRMVLRMEALRPALLLARHSMGTRLLDTLINRVDQILIGSFFGATALGLYALAVRLYDVLFQSVCLPIATVMLPYLAPAANDAGLFKQRFLLVLRTTALCAPPLFLCSALFLPDLMPWLFGPKWTPAIPYIQIVLGMGALQAMTFTHTAAFAALGKPWANLVVSGITTVAWLATLFWLPTLGAIYAAVLWAARSALGVVMQVLLMRTLGGVRLRDYWQATRPAFLASAAVVLTVLLLRNTPLLPPGQWWSSLLGGAAAAVALAATAVYCSEHIRGFLSRRHNGG